MDNERKAERARAILGDPLVVGAFKAIRERQIAAFTNSAPDNPAAREQAHQMLMAVNQLEVELRDAIDSEAIKSRKVRKRDGD